MVTPSVFAKIFKLFKNCYCRRSQCCLCDSPSHFHTESVKIKLYIYYLVIYVFLFLSIVYVIWTFTLKSSLFGCVLFLLSGILWFVVIWFWFFPFILKVSDYEESLKIYDTQIAIFPHIKTKTMNKKKTVR